MSIVSGWCGAFLLLCSCFEVLAGPSRRCADVGSRPTVGPAPVRSRTSAGHPSVGTGAEFAPLLAIFLQFGTLADFSSDLSPNPK